MVLFRGDYTAYREFLAVFYLYTAASIFEEEASSCRVAPVLDRHSHRASSTRDHYVHLPPTRGAIAKAPFLLYP